MFLDIFGKKKQLQKLLMIAHVGRESVNKNKMSFKFQASGNANAGTATS